MKQKLTLSLDAADIRAAKAESRRSGKTVSDMLADAIRRRTKRKRKGERWSDRWGGTLAPLTEADLQRDDKLGHIARRIRSTKPRTAKTTKAKRA